MQWRLILHGAADGAWNMAVDEALLRVQSAGDAPPTVRFYSWTPACVSIGRFQDVSSLQPEFINGMLQADEGKTAKLFTTDQARHAAPPPHHLTTPPPALVRRPTGGRAVLHQHEVTY